MNGTAVEAVETEVLPPEIKQKVEAELAPFRQHSIGEHKPITNDAEEMVSVVVVAQRKRDYKELEEIRDRLVRPYNTIVNQINAAFKPETEKADIDWRLRDQDLSIYRAAKQAAIDAANRKAIADAEEARRAKEAKEEAARQEAKRLRDEQERLEQDENNRILQAEMDRQAAEKKIRDDAQAVIDAKERGDEAAARAAQDELDMRKRAEEERLQKAEGDRLAAVAEQAKLEKAAIKQDAKADIAATEATMIAPTIQVNDSLGKKTLSDGSSVGTRQVQDWRFDNGAPIYVDPLTRKKQVEYYADDVKMAGIEIPKGCLLVDLSKLGTIVKAGVPIKGCTRFTRSATTADKK